MGSVGLCRVGSGMLGRGRGDLVGMVGLGWLDGGRMGRVVSGGLGQCMLRAGLE